MLKYRIKYGCQNVLVKTKIQFKSRDNAGVMEKKPSIYLSLILLVANFHFLTQRCRRNGTFNIDIVAETVSAGDMLKNLLQNYDKEKELLLAQIRNEDGSVSNI